MERRNLNGQIYEEACAWFIECRAGDLKDAARQEFDRWLRKSPEHLSAYLEISAIWDEAPSLDAAGKYPAQTLIREARADRDNVVALPDGRAVLGRAAPPESESRVPPAAGAAKARRRRWWRSRLGAIAASIIGIAIGGGIWLESPPTYATDTGEQRSLEFADGSTVSLNSRSKIRVRYSDRERKVELLAGQALFHVAKDHSRPFVVKVGSTLVRAVGTEFDVYQKRADTVVTVVEGRVAVLARQAWTEGVRPALPIAIDSGQLPPPGARPAADGAGGNIFVSAGEQLTVAPDRLRKSSHANVASVTAWTQRQLVFESASLAEVAEEFNRYNARQLVIVDPSLDAFHISGVFSSTDPASLIRFLRERPGLRVVEKSSEIEIDKNN